MDFGEATRARTQLDTKSASKESRRDLLVRMLYAVAVMGDVPC